MQYYCPFFMFFAACWKYFLLIVGFYDSNADTHQASLSEAIPPAARFQRVCFGSALVVLPTRPPIRALLFFCGFSELMRLFLGM